jgi:hypothetical protein
MRLGGATWLARLLLLAAVGCAGSALAPAAASAQGTNVLLVCPSPGTGSCPSTAYSSIQSAVDAYSPATDWGVLIWPGDYHETGAPHAGVYVDQTKTGIHIRGLDRNQTIVDGTLSSTATPCSSQKADQNETAGRNGIEVWKASGTWIDNLTACNFLADSSGNGGNEIWWNGGDGSGQIGMGAYWGNYITGTTTSYDQADPFQAAYGIFSSNAGDPNIQSSINHAYASNMNDSAYYIGACQQQCNMALNDVWAENSALGYSGSNAGGKLIIQNSRWDSNRAGIVPNSLNNDDAPPPQNGACAGTQTPCMTIQGNDVHDNNNPNVPGAGIASSAPVGAGIEISGGEFDTVRNNTVHNQGAWGIVVHDFPDPETPPASGVASCQGAVGPGGSAPFCYFIAHGNQVYNNTLYDNGSFGNPTNGDLGSQPAAPNPRNCFYGNTDSHGSLTTDPAGLQTVDGQPCNLPGVGDSGPLAAELVCASGLLGQCPTPPAGPPVNNYPQQTKVSLAPWSVADAQPSMPNPCQAVPDSAWCSGGQVTAGLTIP